MEHVTPFKCTLPVRKGAKREVALVGAPFDYGVKLVGGRPGAAGGPDAFAEYLCKNFKPEAHDVGLRLIGNVEIVPEQSEETHGRVTKVISEVMKQGMIPLLIGGGHDLTFAGVRALVQSVKGNVGGVNIDAHFDVRPVVLGNISSGTPFRRILTLLGGKVLGKNFVEFGIGAKRPPELLSFIEKNHATVFYIEEVQDVGLENLAHESMRIAASETEAAFASFDIDAISREFAPGCSAPCAEGFSPDQAATLAEMYAANPQFKYFDIMEMNPLYDENQRTLASAQRIVEGLLAGLAKRGK